MVAFTIAMIFEGRSIAIENAGEARLKSDIKIL